VTAVATGHSVEELPHPQLRGAFDTDVHFYVKDGINSVLPYMPAQWRKTFEMRGTKLGGDTPVPQRFDSGLARARTGNTSTGRYSAPSWRRPATAARLSGHWSA
jgi:hypothetical protein